MFRFLFCVNGKPSMSKLWTNIANATVTYIIITHADTMQPEVILYYLGVVGGYELGKRYVDAKVKQLGIQDVPDTSIN